MFYSCTEENECSAASVGKSLLEVRLFAAFLGRS